MNAQDVISRVDRIKPNAFADDDKLQWIDSLEGMIQAEIYLLRPSEIVRIATLESVLSAPFPYDALYDLYLQAMIDFHNGEYDRYNSTYEMFNSKWEDFSVWYTTHYPTIGSVMFGSTEVSCNHQGDCSDDNSGDDKYEDQEMMKTVILRIDPTEPVVTNDATAELNNDISAGPIEINFTSEGATFEELTAELKAGRPVAAYALLEYDGGRMLISLPDMRYFEKKTNNTKDDLLVICKDCLRSVTYEDLYWPIYWFQGKISTIEPDWR